MTDEQVPDPLATFDWTNSESPSIAVVTAIAETVGEDPLAITPLCDTVDTDALDGIFDARSRSGTPPSGCLEFEYENHWVIVKSNGRGYIYDRDVGYADSGELQTYSATEHSS